jgi:NADH-quinone oxidoreductase subunit G
MAVIYIDNKPYEVKDGQNLLTACLGLGFDIPYFCWHPALDSVGACRMCAVKQFRDEKDTRGRIVMSCITPAQDGTRISVDDPEIREFRARVIEFLMLNHPHDCPVCEEGGECHLQDMTVMTGHVHRSTRFKKRTHRNQYLGPFLNHELNRCIQCYRCVRFYRDYAGGRDLNVFGIHNSLYFGRFEEGVLENEFSGNLAEVCPTGVFTDKTQRKHSARPWDLQTAPSICVHCSLGCNTIPGDRYGTLRRIRNRFNGEVNRYFLCDRGRFGYEFVNRDDRIRKPLVRIQDQSNQEAAEAVTKDSALDRIKSLLASASGVIGIGSPRASLESNYALRSFVGPERFYSGMSDSEARLVSTVLDVLHNGTAQSASLIEMATSDAVLILGEDLTNTAAMSALSIRQSVRRTSPWSAVDKLRVPRWNDLAVRMVTEE